MERGENLERTLEDIGLSHKEARIYLSLLPLGSTTAYRLAEQSGVKKPTVYVILEDLRKKGLVLKVPHAKKALFAARSIEEYIDERTKKLESARSILPRLYSLKPNLPNVYFYTGISGVAQALEHKYDSMRDRTYHSFYGNLEGCSEEVKKLYREWDERAIENDISFKIIMAKRSIAPFYSYLLDYSKRKDEVEIKLLEEYEYPANVSWEIGEDFVRINDEKSVHTTVIDDAATARAMRQIFKIVWEKGV